MRSVTVTLSEDDLYRVYMALHEKIASWNRQRDAAPVSVEIIVGKYQPVLDRIRAAYQQCITEVCHVGCEDEGWNPECVR